MLPLKRIVVEVCAESQASWDAAISQEKGYSWPDDLVHIADNQDIINICMLCSSCKTRKDRIEKGISEVVFVIPDSLTLYRIIEDTIYYLILSWKALNADQFSFR